MADPPVSHRFGALLRRLRTEAGLTQERLAELAGLGPRRPPGPGRGGHRGAPPGPPRTPGAGAGLGGRARGGGEGEASPAAARAHPPPPPAAPRAPALPDAPTPLVGRADELAALDRFLDGKGTPVLLLAGEPGIGKTRLLQAAT